MVGVGSNVALKGKVAVAMPEVGSGVGVPATVVGARPLGASASAEMPIQ